MSHRETSSPPSFGPEERSRFDALSFDCYGTLIDWELGIGRVLAAWADAVDLSLTVEELLTLYATQEARAEREQPRALYPDILARSFRAMGQSLEVEVADSWAERLGDSVGDWPAFPDSRQALERLRTRYQLVVLSNVDRASLARSLVHLGVEFEGLITAEDVGSYKPNPANFDRLQAFARSRGIHEGRLLHVAQSLFHDHVPAHRAGLPSVWINRRHGRAGWGATPPPSQHVTVDWIFPDLSSFADAAVGDTDQSM
ncbi:haloacid dehalogenase type II [Segeticoccus rhizosphaerae]|uniref:haloacid dehalogenase type II n=1 Tax=Segeticoccus rhizosphaerae TaxID=1104777 RepID=UPI0010BF98A1|nr:haloacid dehalogenase type II [Ornithinicoccus soli]